jgi:hypothetical protein
MELSEFEEACAGNRQPVRDYVYANGRLIADVKPATAAVQVGFVLLSSSVNEASGVASVSVRVTIANQGATVCPVTVRYSTADGSAIAGTDYTTASNTLTFDANTPNNTMQTIQVPLTNDSLCRGNRTFSLQLSDSTGAALLPGTGSHVVTIVDDDVVCTTGTKQLPVVEDHRPNGGLATYTIVLTNNGSQAQRDVAGPEFTDTVSPFLTLLSPTASSGTVSTNDHTVTWNGGIPAGGSVTITIPTQINVATESKVIDNIGVFNYDLHNSNVNTISGVTNTATFQVQFTGKFYTIVPPCRVVDTRFSNGPLGAPSLLGGASRTFPMTGGVCQVPSTAKALALNLTVVGPTAGGSVTLYPASIPLPNVTSINYSVGQTRGNNSVSVLNAGQLAAYCGQPAGSTTDLVIDVTGYFQ